MIREIDHLGLPCLELTNGDARLVIPTGFGPRVLSYELDEGENVFGWHPGAAVETPLGTWRPHGGHRLWAAPENMPLSYAPDNDPVEHRVNGDLSLTVTGTPDPIRGLKKEITITLADRGIGVTVDHQITNNGREAVEISAWALTIMRAGGEAVVPNEPFAPYSGDNLLPVRTIALWSYTDLTDARWTLGRESIRLRCDEQFGDQQKFGVLNKQGWVSYELPDVTFTKRFEYVDGASYPDLNSNTEIYTAGGFIEVETLSPLKQVQPGESVEYQERWELLSRSTSF